MFSALLLCLISNRFSAEQSTYFWKCTRVTQSGRWHRGGFACARQVLVQSGIPLESSRVRGCEQLSTVRGSWVKELDFRAIAHFRMQEDGIKGLDYIFPLRIEKAAESHKAGFVRFPYVQFIWGQIQLLPPWNRKSIASCSAEHREHCMSALVRQKRGRMQLAWWIKGREKSLNYEKSTLEESNHMWRTNAGKSPNCLEQMPLLLK